MEPLSQCGAGCHVLCPLLQFKGALLHSARPQAFHKNARTIGRSRWLINALHGNHAYLCPAVAILLATSIKDFWFLRPSKSDRFYTNLTPELIVNRRVNRWQHCAQSQKYTTARPGFFLQITAGTSLHGSFGFRISYGKSWPSSA